MFCDYPLKPEDPRPVAATDELDDDDNTEFEPFDWEALGVRVVPGTVCPPANYPHANSI